MYYVYFIKSFKTEKVYVGYTSKDPKERLKEHNKGSNKWSRQHRPLSLIYYESFVCKEDAKLREDFYKTGFGKKIKKSIIEAVDKGA